jgi:magnesium chelatase family protein
VKVDALTLAKLNTFALVGIDALPVEVEVNVAGGLPKTVMVGLPELAVRESVHRIERALANLGYHKPRERVIINLAPADLKKDAGAFDLPIAIGMIATTGNQLGRDPEAVAEALASSAIVGELALDGRVRPVRGALSMAMAARDQGLRRLIVPLDNAREAAVVTDIAVHGVASLQEAVGLLTGAVDIAPTVVTRDDLAARLNVYDVDFSDVRGQESAKRALVVAAAGGHNLLMLGSPGSGKTMLARRLPTILPPLTPEESLETTRIYSATGLLPVGESLLRARPFRAPHHTISDAGMVGGGSVPAPGEISLAHHGILFLDEFPEYSRRSLEVLRQPLEEGRVTIARARHTVTFPARFMLVAALNPCPCGYLGDARRPCKCPPPAVDRYLSRLSGPLLDRIDLHIEVPAVPFEELTAKADGTSSASMREQVLLARRRQRERFGDGAGLNGRMSSRQVRHHCTLEADGQGLLKSAVEELGLSARAHDRILRVARTIADLDESPTVRADHLIEAIGYRTLDRKLWMRS